MQIDDIKNPSLKKLFEEVRHHSATIAADAGDALEESSSDAELITSWQSRLENLHEETQHFWGGLENIKQAPPSASALPYLFQAPPSSRYLAYQWIDEYKKDKGIGWSPLPHKPTTIKEYSVVFDKFVKDGYKVYAEFRDGRYHIFVKRLTEMFAVRENTATDINREYADLFEKYGTAWADAFNKVQGGGWQMLSSHPRTVEERNRVFVEYAKKGYAVYTESKYGTTTIYVRRM